MTGLSRKIFMGICICVMAVSALSVSRQCEAAAKRSGDYTYIETSKGVTITKYSGKIKKVKIPKKINGKKVTAIDYLAFKGNKKMVEVTVPNTVEKIGSGAFRGCKNLRKVKLSKNIKKLEDGTFVNCRSLKRVVMPERLKKIERACFKYCEKLEKIDLSNVEEIDRIAFEGNVSLKGTLDLSGAEKVWNEAFKGCTGIEKVIFSEELELLGDSHYGYVNNGIQSKHSITPFAGCDNITAFEIASNNVNFKTIDGVIYGKSGEWLIAYPAAKTGTFVVPESVKGIGIQAFSCAKVSEVILGSNVTELGKKAFEKSMITTMKFPKLADGVTLMAGAGCFDNCNNLVSVSFAENAVSSGNVTFRYCSKLTDVYLPDTMTALSREMFYDCVSLRKIVLPKSVKSLPVSIFSGCTSLSGINLENVSAILISAFENCRALSGVLTLNADTIQYRAFANCTGLTEVVLNKKLINYGDMGDKVKFTNPFAGCTGITKFTVNEPGTYKSYEGIVYANDMKTLVSYPAKATGEIIIPYGVVSIASYALSGSEATVIKLSESVLDLQEQAICDSKVKKIYISSSVENMTPFDTANIFKNCPELEEISVDEDNPYFESIDGVLYGKKIELYSLSDEQYMLLVYPPAKTGKKYTVKKCDAVSEYAFADNKYLKKLYFESDKTDINGALFTNSKKVSVYLQKNMKIYPSSGHDKNGKYVNLYVFSNLCSKCKVFVKKGAEHEKLLREENNDALTVKYY